jgi:uncharacterized protein (TIGR03066 family)
MAHIPGRCLACLWLVLLAALAAALEQPCNADSPSREEGGVKEEKTTEKIVGRWQMVKPAAGELPQETRLILTFDQDSKLTLQFSSMGQGQSYRGTYEVVGNKLTLRIKDQNEEAFTIKTLDGKKLVIVYSKGRETAFKRVK